MSPPPRDKRDIHLRTLSRSDASADNGNSRGISDVDITVSPVYVSPKILKLRKGEAVDHPGASR